MTIAIVSTETPTLHDLEAMGESHLAASIFHMQEFINIVERIQTTGAWKASGHTSWKAYFETRWQNAHISMWSTFRGLRRVVPLQIAAQAELGIEIKQSHARAALRGLDTSDPDTQDIAIERLGRAKYLADRLGQNMEQRHIDQSLDTDDELTGTGTVSIDGASIDPHKALDAGIDAITYAQINNIREATQRRNEQLPTKVIKGNFAGTLRDKDTGELFTEDMIVGIVLRQAS